MRDPRHDPMVGDVVYKGKLSRTVDTVPENEVWYTSQAGHRSRCWITTWRNWCRGATLEPLPSHPTPLPTDRLDSLSVRYVELENRVHNSEQLLVSALDRLSRLELLIGSGEGIGIEGL